MDEKTLAALRNLQNLQSLMMPHLNNGGQLSSLPILNFQTLTNSSIQEPTTNNQSAAVKKRPPPPKEEEEEDDEEGGESLKCSVDLHL